MNVTTTPAPKSSVLLEIELPPERLTRAVDEAVRRLSRRTRVAGFRPGKRCFCSVPSFDDPSHVRHFRDAAEVVARYGPFFRDLDVATFASPRSDPHARYDFFLFEGVRNDHVIPDS